MSCELNFDIENEKQDVFTLEKQKEFREKLENNKDVTNQMIKLIGDIN
jgi:hypothetical protein